MPYVIDTANDQVAEAERLIQHKIAEGRATNPEYTVVENTTALGTQVCIYFRAEGIEQDWTFLREHHGADGRLLASTLRELGAAVHEQRQMLHLNMQGIWQQKVAAFNQPPESIRLAAEIIALYRQADLLDAEWTTNHLLGDSGAAELRTQAGHKIALLKNVNPKYPVHTLRPRPLSTPAAKGWYLNG